MWEGERGDREKVELKKDAGSLKVYLNSTRNGTPAWYQGSGKGKCGCSGGIKVKRLTESVPTYPGTTESMSAGETLANESNKDKQYYSCSCALS